MNPNTANPRLPTAGTVLGEYELHEQLGAGGFAVVYRAIQQRLDREVAVKVLTPAAVTGDTDLPQRFLREIDLVKRLEHPNIVRLYDFGHTEGGLLWMAMELVRGSELQDIISDEGRLSLPRSKKIGLQILSGLAEAHELNIVHRDLKPGNIMLTRKGAQQDLVKLLDFGVGKALGEDESSVIHNLTTTQGGTYGTPRYMAPEQLKNDEMGPHTDVYATGLILYEMIVGQPAVTGSTTYEVLVKQISKALEIPAWLEDTPLAHLIRRATAKEWQHRYANALEFYEALESLDLSHETYGDPGRSVTAGIRRSSTPSSPVVLRDSGELGEGVPTATGPIQDETLSTGDVAPEAAHLSTGTNYGRIAIIATLVAALGVVAFFVLTAGDGPGESAVATEASGADEAQTQPADQPEEVEPGEQPAQKAPETAAASPSEESSTLEVPNHLGDSVQRSITASALGAVFQNPEPPETVVADKRREHEKRQRERKRRERQREREKKAREAARQKNEDAEGTKSKGNPFNIKHH